MKNSVHLYAHLQGVVDSDRQAIKAAAEVVEHPLGKPEQVSEALAAALGVESFSTGGGFWAMDLKDTGLVPPEVIEAGASLVLYADNFTEDGSVVINVVNAEGEDSSVYSLNGAPASTFYNVDNKDMKIAADQVKEFVASNQQTYVAMLGAMGNPESQVKARQKIAASQKDDIGMVMTAERYKVDITHTYRIPAGSEEEARTKAEALMSGRDYVVPEDVQAVVYPVLRHRIILNYEAEAEEITTDKVIKHILSKVNAP